MNTVAFESVIVDTGSDIVAWEMEVGTRGEGMSQRADLAFTRLHKPFCFVFCVCVFFLRPATDHGEQDDLPEPRHHLRPQPAAQAEELGQGVQRPELGPGRGEHGRHRRAAEDDRQLPNPLHGQSCFLKEDTATGSIKEERK